MAEQPIDQLKQWFITGATPTQQQFYDWLDSFIHKGDGIEMSDVDGLIEALQSKVDQEALSLVIAPVKLSFATDPLQYTIPKGFMIEKIVVWGTFARTIKIGISEGGEEIMFSQDTVGDVPVSVNMDVIALVSDVAIFFTGVGDKDHARLYLRSLDLN